MKIAIIGTGISGLTSGYLLSRKNDVTVFEAGDYIGGHTHTVDVETRSGKYSIDTGFIVFNDWTYPSFIRLMNEIGVRSKDTQMSFSVKTESTGLEYNGTNLNGLFSQRSNLLKPSFHRMIRDILRFNRESLEVLDSPIATSKTTLGQYLSENNYSRQFKDHYIVPMGAAIWSASVTQMEDFPIQYFVRFFKNHGMLSVDDRPTWRVICSGSRSYIAPLTLPFKNKIRLTTPVESVSRLKDGVKIRFNSLSGPGEEVFDQVIFACHSDQALKLISDKTPEEMKILESFAYQPNSTLLHTDKRVLPARKRAWAAWNYWVPAEPRAQVAVTYNMNILQGIESPETFCVSLNMDNEIDPALVLARFIYHHPVYTQSSVQAQLNWNVISGKNRTHFCGAYWGFGFHEDGVKSALRVCKALGEVLDE